LKQRLLTFSATSRYFAVYCSDPQWSNPKPKVPSGRFRDIHSPLFP
jgi:hypothetical protein